MATAEATPRLLVVHIPEELHRRVKSQASLDGLQIREWIAAAAEEKLASEQGAKR